MTFYFNNRFIPSAASEALHMALYKLDNFIFLSKENPWWLRNYKRYKDLWWQCTLLWPAVTNKLHAAKPNWNVAPQRKSVGIKTKMLEHPRSFPPIAYPTRTRTEEHPWAMGLHRNRDEFTLWWQSSTLNHLVRCRQLLLLLLLLYYYYLFYPR